MPQYRDITDETRDQAPSPPAPQAAGEGRSRPDREALAAEIVRALEERGLPPGTWLVDIAKARLALQEADSLLRRLESAIIRSASGSEPGR